MSDTLHQAVNALTNRLKLAIGRARFQFIQNNDVGPVQVVKTTLSAKEDPNLKRVAEFGFTSRPPAGADGICVFITGDRSNGVIIATNHQSYRLSLANDGEAALYDAFGKSVILGKDNIQVNAAGKDVIFNMGGGNFKVLGAADIDLGGTRKIVLDGDPVTGGGTVTASSTHAKGG